MKIAICDDDNSFLQNVKFLINKIYSNPDKLSIYEYESGEQFLLQFKPQLYDVIILDIEMCGITGLEVAEEIRNARTIFCRKDTMKEKCNYQHFSNRVYYFNDIINQYIFHVSTSPSRMKQNGRLQYGADFG